jgi:hypothetical protein
MPLGICHLASYLNHSCVANANRCYYGDLMMVYALEDVPRGKEITIEYLPASTDLRRQGRFQISFGFTCDCQMCLEQAQNPSVDERIRICARIEQVLQREAVQADIAELEELLRQLSATYHNEKYRVNMAFPLSELADRYFRFLPLGHLKSILALEQALEYCTSISPMGLPRITFCTRIMCLAFSSVNDEHLIRAKKKMLDLVRVYAGVEPNVFRKIWVPAILAYDPIGSMLETGIQSFDAENDLRKTRELRRRLWKQRGG